MFTLLIGALGGLPPLSIDMGLPGLPAMQAAFGVAERRGALSISLFLAGFGLAQLIMGPLSDRIGRRPVMLFGLSLFTLAGLVCLAAPSIDVLLAARFAQGAGAAGGTVLAFAVVRDLFEGEAARQRLSVIAVVVSLAPVIAPTLGSFVLAVAGWRGVYAVLAGTGVALTAATMFGLAETRRQRPPVPIRTVLRHPRTLGYALVGALNQAAVITFIVSSPHVLIDIIGLTPSWFGAVFAVITAGIVLGTWVNGWMVRQGWRPGTPLAIGMVLTMTLALAGAGLGLTRPVELRTLMPLMIMLTFCRGLVSPNVTFLALERVPDIAGTASAVMGCLQMLMGAVAGVGVGFAFAGFGPSGMYVVMAMTAAPALALWLMVRRLD